MRRQLTFRGKHQLPSRDRKRLNWQLYRHLPIISNQKAKRYMKRFGGYIYPEGIMRVPMLVNDDGRRAVARVID